MLRIFRFDLASLLLLYFQVEIQSGSPPRHQNVVFSNVSQNISAFPLPSKPNVEEASVWWIPLGHQNTTGALVNSLRTTQGPRNLHEYRNGYGFSRVKRYASRIVGGNPAQPHEFPHQVYLSRPNKPCVCGGSIISKWLILAAAHCVQGRNASSITVTAGAHDRFRPTGLEQIRTVDEILVHPNYTRVKHDHDIAILVLSEPLRFSSSVGSIRLPNRDTTYSGNTTMSGWGHTASGGTFSSVLRKVTVPIVPNSLCNSQYYANTEITEQMFCAGEEGQDSCQVGSGGPALCRAGWGLDMSSYVLCGIVSFGTGCGFAGFPGVNVQVSKYTDWILGVLKNLLESHCLRGDLEPSNTAEWTKCVAKYVLPEAGTTPWGNGDKEPRFLLVANRTSVSRIDLNQMDLLEQVPLGYSDMYPIAVDFDLKNDCLYWIDSSGYTKRLHMNGNRQPEVLVSPTESSDSNPSLAFDWMSGNLYFTDYAQSIIGVIRTNGGISSGFHGTMRKILLETADVRGPWGITVHPEKGYIFWTDVSFDGNSFIGRADLDGSHAKKIVSNDNSSGLTTPILDDPRGIALDYIDNRIYWVDYDLGRIMTADLNGADVRIVFQAGSFLMRPLVFGIYQSTIYWTDMSMDVLYKDLLQLDKTVEANSISKIGVNQYFDDLKIYGASSQQGENLCTHSNCIYICMVSPGPQRTVSCLCPDGFTKENNDSCV